MFCEKCGYKIEEDDAFCENCGEPTNTNASEGISNTSDSETEEIREIQETSVAEEASVVEEVSETQKADEIVDFTAEQDIKISENITKTGGGSYKWMYEFSLWKNPAILITVFKVLLIALMVPALLMFFLTLGEGMGEAFKLFVFMLGIGFILMFVLMIAAYIMLSLTYGGKYYVLFQMDKNGVNHIQLDKQHKKAQALGFLTSLIGAASNNVTAAGAGLLGASKKNMYTNFKKVKTLKFSPNRNTIYLNETLNKNQIYVAKEDYFFVKEFILENCPKKIKIIEK